MDPELKKLKEMLEGIQTSLKDGLISKETFEEKVKEISEKVDELGTKQKEILEAMAKRSIVMKGLEDEKRTFSLFAAIRGMLSNEWGDEYEKGIMTEYKTKVMASTPGSSGGYLIPPQAITQIIELLRAESVVIRAGATVMTDLNGFPVEIPKQDGGATGYWVAENSAITASDLTIGQLTMSPKQASVLVKLSNRLLRNSNPGAEGLIRSDIAIALSLLIDLAALRGTGASNQPTGIINISGIGDLNLGANGARANFVDMDKLAGVVEDAKALRGNLAYVMHPKAKRLLKQERIAQFSTQTLGQYVLLPMSDTMLGDALGYPFFTTTQLPTDLTKGSGTNLTELFFGNWRELLIGQWGGMEIATSNVAGDASGGAFSANQTWIRAIQEVDIQVRHPESFAISNEAQSQ